MLKIYKIFKSWICLFSFLIRSTFIKFLSLKSEIQLETNIDDYCILLNFLCGWYILNTRGIDLNLQFPANWDQAKEIKFSQGFVSPAPRDFVGSAPLIAPEAIALYNFTLSHNFRLILAYHTQGRTIYWRYLNFLPPGSYYIGEQFADSSGYTLADTPYASSFAGYKDWFIQNYNLPRLHNRSWFAVKIRFLFLNLIQFMQKMKVS